MRNLIFCLQLIFISTLAFGEGDIVAPKFGKELKAKGISLSYERSSVAKLHLFISAKINELELISKNKNKAKEARDDAKKDLAFINYSYKKFKEALKLGVETEVYDSYNLLMRVLYSIEARPLEGRKIKLKEILRFFKRLKIRIPLPEDINSPIGLEQASLEAQNLIDPHNENRYMGPLDLAKLTPLEISQLDISKNHTFWLTKESQLKRSIDPWTELEQWAEEQVQTEIDKKQQPFTYNINEAQKVLFFDKIKISGTSPKINVKDAFKAKWKVKWGIEIQVDPIVNDLYLKAGGRYTDLTYSMMRNDYVLILKGKGEDSCDNIRSPDMFKKCFKKSSFKFKIEQYISTSGVLKTENIKTILNKLPSNPNYTKESLIGRQYITFKESLLEFKGRSFLKSVGVSSYNQFGAENDRVRRGLVIFNHFIRNTDAKDENNKILVADNYDEQAKYLLETQSDSGASLADPLRGGNLNGMKINDSFVKRRDNDITFKQWVFYEPEAWAQATFSDSLWMVRKIVRLTQKDFSKSIDRIKWPKFMKELLLYKLIGRRNKLAKAFKVENLLPLGEIEMPAPNVEFSLKTKEDRDYAEKELGLASGIIEKQLKEYELINKKGISKHVDKLVSRGKLVSCDKTVLFGLLEKNYYPTGLTRRLSRFSKFRKLRDCAYIPRRTRFP